jgi:hypothetical protein
MAGVAEGALLAVVAAGRAGRGVSFFAGAGSSRSGRDADFFAAVLAGSAGEAFAAAGGVTTASVSETGFAAEVAASSFALGLVRTTSFWRTAK